MEKLEMVLISHAHVEKERYEKIVKGACLVGGANRWSKE